MSHDRACTEYRATIVRALSLVGSGDPAPNLPCVCVPAKTTAWRREDLEHMTSHRGPSPIVFRHAPAGFTPVDFPFERIATLVVGSRVYEQIHEDSELLEQLTEQGIRVLHNALMPPDFCIPIDRNGNPIPPPR